MDFDMTFKCNLMDMKFSLIIIYNTLAILNFLFLNNSLIFLLKADSYNRNPE